MTKSLLVLISLTVAYLSVVSAFPSCCRDISDFKHVLSRFHCDFSCSVSERPILSSCISCLGRTRSNASALTSRMKPDVVCRDVFHKWKDGERKVWAQLVLSWSSRNLPLLPSVYSVEARTEDTKWHFIGMTNATAVLVDNVDYGEGYKFRVTSFVLPDLVQFSYTSDWISVTSALKKDIKWLNLTQVDFRLHKNQVQAVVEWTLPKESPCSLLLYWRRAEHYFVSDQKILTLPDDFSPAVLPDLLFETKYFLTLSPIYQSDTQRILSAEMWFHTPSCLSLTRENFTLCAPGPPINVSASWIRRGHASLSWLPPHHASSQNKVSGYHVSVSEASQEQLTILRYKESFALEKNVLNVTVTDLKPGVLYLFEIRATSDGGIGPPVAVNLDVKDPYEVVQPMSNVPWHYIVPSAILAVVAILIAVCINFSRLRKMSKSVGFPSGVADVPENLLPYLLSLKKIDLLDTLGKGEFGVVNRGVYSRNKQKEVVAVKVFPSESVSRSRLLHEVEILHTIGRHPNVVGLIGFTLDVDRMCLVLEYCALGNLHSRICRLKRELSVIKKQLSDPKQPLIDTYKSKDENYGIQVSSYIHQIAVGMEYISSLNVIHRDLAARNILLCDEKHVKIADFGLAKDVSEDSVYTVLKQKKLPIRWMAPESLERQIFSTHSDVWSFGILVWEIFKFGKMPYSTLNNTAIPLYLKSGFRLPKPRASSQVWYDLMLECWHVNPVKRPTFKELVAKTENILSRLCQYTVLSEGH